MHLWQWQWGDGQVSWRCVCLVGYTVALTFTRPLPLPLPLGNSHLAGSVAGRPAVGEPSVACIPCLGSVYSAFPRCTITLASLCVFGLLNLIAFSCDGCSSLVWCSLAAELQPGDCPIRGPFKEN